MTEAVTKRRLASLTALSEYSLLTALLLTAMLGLTARAAPAVSDPIPVSEDYVLRTWDADDGLPSSIVYGITQTPDGYLWVASWKGLARFDGVAFTPFLKNATPGLQSDRTRAVYVARNGDLWVGLELGGVARMRGNRFETISPIPPTNSPTAWIGSFAEDARGGIWFGHASIGKAVRWQDGKLSEFTTNEGLKGFETFVRTDVGRRIWFFTKQACGIFDGTRFQPIDPDGGERPVLAPASDGGMWATREQRLLLRYHADGSREVVADISQLCGPSGVTVLHEDRAGNVWIGTRTEGLFRLHQGIFESVPISHPDVESIFEDREDNLWVGTRGGGLNRLRPRAFVLHQKKDGLHNDPVTSLCQDGEGKLWLVGSDGVPVRALDSANQSFALPTNLWDVVRGPVLAMCSDPAGGVWIASGQGLWSWRDGVFSLESLRESAIRLLVDKQGDLWAATTRGALVRHHAGTNTVMPIAEGPVQALALGEDAAGQLWVGTKEGMIFWRQNEQFLPVPLPGASPGEIIRFIVPDVNDTVWIGALQGGLYRWRGGQIKRLSRDAGLPVGDLRSLEIEPDGDFWIGTDRGLFRAARDEIDAAMDGRQQFIRAQSYGRNEGLPSLEFEIGVRNTTTRTRDGHIWFATVRGALEILPERFQKTAPLLPVLIEEIRVDGTSMPIGGSGKIELPPKPGQVEIRFTLPQLSASEQMRFRYRLIEPGNEKWIYAGNQRRATFTHLPPGEYRFEVAAAEADGPWLAATASLGFTVRAAWFETAWFKIDSGLLGGLVLTWLVRFIVKRRMSVRIQQLTDKLATQQALEKAFAETQGLKNQFRLAIDTIPGLVWTGLPDGNVDLVNQRWLEFTGFALEDAIGRNWQNAIHPDDLAGLTDYWRSLLASGKPGETEVRLRRFDGKYRWFLFRAVPLHDAQGKIVKWYGTNTDIEDRRRAEDALRTSEAFLAEAQRLSHTGSFAYQPKGKVNLYWSEELFRIFGWEPRPDGISDPDKAYQMVHPEDRERCAEECRAAFRENAGFTQNYRLLLPDGTVRHLHVIWHPVFDEAGELSKYIGTVADVTTTEDLTQKLRRSEFYLSEGQRIAQMGSWSFTAAGICDYLSQELYHILGFDPANGIPTAADYLKLVHPEDREFAEEAIQRMIRDGEGCDAKKRIIRADGVERVIHCVGIPVRENGVVKRFIGTLMDVTKQELLSHELQEREAYLAEAQRLTLTGSFGWNASADTHFWSEETYRIFEYEPSTRITMKLILDRIHPQDISLVQKVVAGASEAHGFDFEYRLMMPGGSVKYVHAVAHAVGEKSDSVEFIGAVMDITERKKTQEALNAAKARFEGILEIAEDAIISVDSAQRIVLFNQGAEKVFGSASDEVMGKPLDILLPQRFAHSHRGHIEGFAKSPDVSRKMGQRREVFGRRKDGSEFPAEASISKLALGSEVVFTVILRDITDRKRAEEALRKSEQQWKDVFENNPTMYFMVKADGTILSVNPFGAEQLGYLVDELVGSPVMNIFYEPDRVAVQEKIAGCLKQLGYSMSWEFRKVRKDGSVLWVRETARAVMRDEQPIVLVACEDITERKRVEEALQKVQAALAHVTRVSTLGEVAASIAHELNQPLTAIVNNANACLGLIGSGGPLPREMREALADIVSDAERGGAIIERTRRMARRSTPQRAPVRLSDVVNDIVVLASAESLVRGIVIHTEVAPDLPLVQGDRVQLQQVLLNLVVNGMDAMNTVKDSDRRLDILVQLDEQDGLPAIKVRVRDRGIGLDAGEADRLFEAFYTTKPHGMGLGLAICRSIIEAHGGGLWAESNAGPGATFTFRLPAGVNAE